MSSPNASAVLSDRSVATWELPTVDLQIDARRTQPLPSGRGETLGRSADTGNPAAIAQTLSAQALEWASPLAPKKRCWQRLEAVEGTTTYAIAWPMSSSVALHDHGGASGAFFVVRGALQETVVSPPPDQLTPTRTHTVQVGEYISFDENHVHGLENLAPVPALSVHVYAPTLRSMTYFAVPNLTGLWALRTEWIEGAIP
jgi:mannose-6-phosphate isomerase-like protein (cupin superfamily)